MLQEWQKSVHPRNCRVCGWTRGSRWGNVVTMEWRHDEFTLCDDPARIDLAELRMLLSGTYWAEKRSREAIEKSVRHSLSFGLFHESKMIGFARVITDRATVGYLCDVVIGDDFRARGLGRWMIATILEHPDLRSCRVDLFTRDSQSFYQSLGFGPHKYTSMVRYPDADEEPRDRR